MAALFASAACAPSPSPKAAAAPVPSATAVTPPRVEKSEPSRIDEATLARLRSLRDEQGGAALLAQLGSSPADSERSFALHELVFDLLSGLNDPGAADALWTFLSRPQHPHFETRAAQALAALGDLRAVPFLAHRLRLDASHLYSEAHAWEQPLRRDDSERVTSARLLAELAELHPWARASIAQQAEPDLWFWLVAYPSPHANGLRALASLGSPEHLAELRAWADPQEPLPVAEQQPPLPEAWVIAQSALRYLGQSREPASFAVLLRALDRRPRDLDVSSEAMLSGGVAILAMSLRALGVGAADGLSELRDGRAFNPLLQYAENALNHEQARLSAGAALGWVGSDKELEQLATRVPRGVPGVPAREREFQLSCFIEALRGRPLPRVAALLLPMLDARMPPALRDAAARAIGRNSIDRDTQGRLLALLRRPELKTHAALALLLGGSTSAALAAVQSYAGSAQPSLSELRESWSRSFGYFTRDDVANGTLFRYVENADALAALLLSGEPQIWARAELGKSLQALKFDNGPHSVTRVILNDQLRRAARGSDLRVAKLAVRAFVLLGEPGHLLDLSRGPGPVAHAARQAYRALLAENAGKPTVASED
ncbi:MAG TPA: hypothetical protein VFK05_02290 [Polyangiaceae bacterium]|nr:hypothetical protein [Polyangiaceae bacterium]